MARRPETADLSRAARDLLGHQSLRSGQADAIGATLDGRDVLAVMPTGHGKSALYQLPAALDDGLTVVVSPLIALQRDQVRALGEAPAGLVGRTLNSTQGLGRCARPGAWSRPGGDSSSSWAPNSWPPTRCSTGCQRPA
jgi:ATP-dependent DNA helicase RecQ